MTTAVDSESTPAPSDPTAPQPHRSQRERLALAFALVAVAAAVVGALGPAERIRATYEWPPPVVPAATPERLWYTPLLLARYRPERVEVVIPCSPAPALRAARTPTTILATAHKPASAGGLAIVRTGTTAAIRIGHRELARVHVDESGPDKTCTHQLTIEDHRWTLTNGTTGRAREDAAPTMPVVTGLFSELDLARAPRPTIRITTAVNSTHATIRQMIAWLLAASAAAAALLLVARRRPRHGSLSKWLWGAVLDHRHRADAVIAGVLLGWWILSPAFFDDGWVVARQRSFAVSGGFSNYYDSLAVNLPNGYWLEWLQHWVVQSSDALVVFRIPTLLCLGALWIGCRLVLEQVPVDERSETSFLVWTLAVAFAGLVMAWGMTLRPEPVTALLTVGALWCAGAFAARPAAAPLAGLAVLLPLSLTGHHAGVVTAAPALAIAPAVIRWSRSHLRTVLTLSLCSVAVFLTLFSVGSDARQRLADAADTRTYSTGIDHWYQEWLRYERLDLFVYATPLRRAAVVLMVFTVALFLIRRQRGRELFDLPVITLAIGLALLVTTPSKHPWHFGALMGVTATATACEALRLRREAKEAARLSARALILIAGLFFATGWAWSTRGPWNDIDLMTLDWRPALEASFPLSVAAALLVLGVLLVLVAVGMVRRRDRELYSAPWRTLSWTAAILLLPAMAFTTAILALDSARTDSWTLARENVRALHGATGCGLADDLRLAGGSISLADETSSPSARTLVLPSLLLYFPCARLPELRDGVIEVPTHIVAPYAQRVLAGYTTSPMLGVQDLYRIAREPLAKNAPRELTVDTVNTALAGARLLPPTVRSTSS